MEKEKKYKAQRKQITIGGQEVSILVEPRVVRFGDTDKVIHKPRITTTHSLGIVEGLVGEYKMRHQDVATYSPRDTEEEAVQAVLDGRGDVAIVNTLPEHHLGEESTLMVLATIDQTGSLPNSTLHLIGRREIVPEQSSITVV